MKKVQLEIFGLSYSQAQSGAYALILAEKNGSRKIPVIIGSAEAQSIALCLEKLKPPRPLTHDLFKIFANAFNIRLVEVCIYKLEEGVFHTEIFCEMKKNKIRVDARTSDSIAIALRFNCPIYATEEIIEKSGIDISFEQEIIRGEELADLESIPKKDTILSTEKLEDYSLDNLKSLLDKLVKEEKYENAVRVRDEIKKRENK